MLVKEGSRSVQKKVTKKNSEKEILTKTEKALIKFLKPHQKICMSGTLVGLFKNNGGGGELFPWTKQFLIVVSLI